MPKPLSQPVYAIGLMSGTSLDGVDAAIIKTDGTSITEIGGSLTIHYQPEFQEKLRGLLSGIGDEQDIEKELTHLHADAVIALLKQENMTAKDIYAVGFHGQTIIHQPDRGITKQIGDGALLAKLIGIDVVNDFRSNDVQQGGQGAPLVPVYHQALMHAEVKPVAVVNIGGVANVTWIGEGGDELLAFDTGTGNALLNDWIYKHIGKTHDENGDIAATGVVKQEVVAEFLRHPFFSTKPPKSLDRNSFSFASSATLADGAATLAAITAETIALAAKHFPAPAKSWVICGGGRHNATLMTMLRQSLNAPVESIDSLGFNGDAIEAEAFAFLAVRSILDLPISFPNTTGVKQPLTGGRLVKSDDLL